MSETVHITALTNNVVDRGTLFFQLYHTAVLRHHLIIHCNRSF